MARAVLGCTTVVAMAHAAMARADAPCARVQAPADLPAAWSTAVRELERQIAQLPASDCQPATLVLSPADPGMRVVATATDGRRAERMVRHPESLVATSLGLVMAIPQLTEPSAGSASAASASSAPSGAQPPPPPAASGSPATAPSATPPVATAASAAPVHLDAPSLSLQVGVDVGGRVAQPTSIATFDIGLHGTLLLQHWLLSAAIRNTPLGLVSAQGLDRDAFRQVSFGLGFGRRFGVGDGSLDLVLEPAIVAMQMEYDYSETVESTGTDVEMSLGALARFVLPVGKGWSMTVTLENDLIPGNLSSVPARLTTPANAPSGAVAAPAFPSWEGALRLGAMGAIL